ncbi:MAG: type II toxin-antitoxin system HicB family antitoxin [Patescibacteria group bacterium]
MKRQFTAIYKNSGKWYLGWVEEVPGVNTQGKTLKEVKQNLLEALNLVLETNKLLTQQDFSKGTGKIFREAITLTS